MRRLVYIIFVLFCMMIMACRSSSEKRIIGVDSMKVIMFDMLKADELYVRILGKDSTARNRKENIRLYDEVFALHHIRKGQFDSSYKFYASHPIQYKVLIDSMEAYSGREKEKLFGKPGQAH